MPKSSSERSSKSEFLDSEFVFWGGVKFNSGIDMGEGGRERDMDLGGDGDLGVERGILGVVEREIWGEMGIWVVETVMWRVVERGIWGGGGDLCLFCQARRVVGESGGGIGIAGEPTHCSVSVFFS